MDSWPHMSIACQTAWIAAGAAALMVALWLWQMRHRDAGIVDVGWAFGIASAAVFAGLTGSGSWEARTFAAVAGGLWGYRLAWYLLNDRVLGRPEDGRYQTMRGAMGRHAQAGFLLFFLFQAGLVVLFALPMVLVAADAREAGWHHALAAAILLAAVVGESVADRQLAHHRADPAKAGTTCRSGLWAWCRHPNYACEWLHWWAWVAAGVGSAHGLWLLAYPLLMFLFLRYLTGIPYTERRALAHRPDYADYQRTVSMLIPWPPARTP